MYSPAFAIKERAAGLGMYRFDGSHREMDLRRRELSRDSSLSQLRRRRGAKEANAGGGAKASWGGSSSRVAPLEAGRTDSPASFGAISRGLGAGAREQVDSVATFGGSVRGGSSRGGVGGGGGGVGGGGSGGFGFGGFGVGGSSHGGGFGGGNASG